MSAPNNGRDLFTQLPLELLREISEYLRLEDRLKLRTVFSKAQEDIVADLVGPILKTIYLSPSAYSICEFHRLLLSAFYRRHIRAVAYIPLAVPASLRRSTQMTLRAFAFTHKMPLTGIRLSVGYDIYKICYEQHWEGSSGLSARYDLAADLAQLPSLSHLAVTTTAKAVGLNASRVWRSDAHYDLGREDLSRAAVRLLESQTDLLHDAMLPLAAKQAQLNLTAITLDYSTDKRPSLLTVFSLLKPLVPDSVDHFLRNERYTKLRTLELNAEKFYFGRISAKVFLQWLKNHGNRSQLREIKLNNILLVPYPGECDAAEVSMTTKALLKQEFRAVLLEACKCRLRSFVMEIDRQPSYALPCPPFARVRSADAAWFDELAEEMQVQIGERGWNFGEYVMNNPWEDEDVCMDV
ncbi:hypothetical protein CBER1_01366 [Cercospora berteroae]|uniref:F-box domain-containing protein n=1 Tax=Cercospora berteroae TaxID=357750 RepID=A0A2S6CCA4_9PEZI|nr:hypothetical protein CBER1_01366 [Cercospora berteroae]